MTPVVKTESLTYSFSNSLTFSYKDIELQAGDTLFVLGKSGSGKSTLLNLIAGFYTPKTGRIMVSDQELSQMSAAQRDVFRGRHIGLVFQRNIFLSSIHIWDNLRWAAWAAGLSFDPSHAENILHALGISNKKRQKPHQLSQGEQQRASIARALINRPQLILADEPTSALDDENALEVIRLLRSVTHDQKAALIVVTHDRRIVSDGDNVYEMI